VTQANAFHPDRLTAANTKYMRIEPKVTAIPTDRALPTPTMACCGPLITARGM
jgi:hypothetical protein